MRYSWHWTWTGPKGAWIAGTVFFVTGLVMAVAVPARLIGEPLEAPPADVAEAAIIFEIMGWTFVGLGGVVLALMSVGLWIRRRQPNRLRVWHWWVGFIGGFLGALLFALPATFAFPFLYLMGQREPGPLFSDMGRSSEDLWIGALFSALGVLVLIILAVASRFMVRGRPR